MSLLEEGDEAGHRPKRQKPEVPEAVVLFLAHAGVAQGRLWEAWKRPVGSRIVFVVHTGGKEVKGDDFVRDHAAPLYTKSGWGDMNSVLAYQEGLRYTLDKYPSFKMIHFVSGSDIPLCSAEHLLATVTDTLFSFASDGRGHSVFKPRDFGLAQIDTKAGERLGKVKLVALHRASHALSHEDARIIASCDFSPLENIHQRAGLARDEFIPATALCSFHGATVDEQRTWLRGVTDNEDVTVGAHASFNHYTNSTMVPDSKRNSHGALYTTMDDLCEDTGRSLRAALWKLNKDAVFFRKIGPGVDFFESPHILPWMQTPEERVDTAFVLDLVERCGTPLKGPSVELPLFQKCLLTPAQYAALLAQYRALDWTDPRNVSIGIQVGTDVMPLAVLRQDTPVGPGAVWSMTISFDAVPGIKPLPESAAGAARIVSNGQRVVAPLWTDAILPFMDTVPVRQARRLVRVHVDKMQPLLDRHTVTFGITDALEHPSIHGTCILQ